MSINSYVEFDLSIPRVNLASHKHGGVSVVVFTATKQSIIPFFVRGEFRNGDNKTDHDYCMAFIEWQ